MQIKTKGSQGRGFIIVKVDETETTIWNEAQAKELIDELLAAVSDLSDFSGKTFEESILGYADNDFDVSIYNPHSPKE